MEQRQMRMRPCLLVLVVVSLIYGCGGTEEPGKGAPRASVEDSLTARASAEKDPDTDAVSASYEDKGLFQEAALFKASGAYAVSADLEEDGAYEALPDEDHLYIHAEEPSVDDRLAFLSSMDDHEKDAVEAIGVEGGVPSIDETDCDYLSPGDPGYCQPAHVTPPKHILN